MLQYLKKVQHEQVEFITGMQYWYGRKFIIAVAHMNRVNERNNIISTINAEKAVKNLVHIHDNSSYPTG